VDLFVDLDFFGDFVFFVGFTGEAAGVLVFFFAIVDQIFVELFAVHFVRQFSTYRIFVYVLSDSFD
jgi:hypothetical protein